LERNLKSYKDLLEQLQEASKDNEAKTQRLDGEMEEFSILALDGEDAICDFKILVANIAKRKQETTEREERLRERFGRDELMMDAHYSALMDLPVSLNVTEKLRATYDMIEKHILSLKALGENVDQSHFVFLIKSKLPKMVISRIEEYKDMEEKWTVESIRKALKRYICAQEVAERQTQVIQSPEGQDTAVKSQKQKSFSSNGLVL